MTVDGFGRKGYEALDGVAEMTDVYLFLCVVSECVARGDVSGVERDRDCQEYQVVVSAHCLCCVFCKERASWSVNGAIISFL